MCTKFQINQVILTLFSGVWDKNPTPVAEKVVKCRREEGKVKLQWATLVGQLKIGQLHLASYFMQISLDLEGLKI